MSTEVASPPSATPTLESRVCSRCRVEKPADAFFRRKERPGGLQYTCKACQKASAAARDAIVPSSKVCTVCRVEKPADQFSRKSAATCGLQSSCKACERDRQRASYRANPERNRIVYQRRYARNREHMKEQARQWRRAHSEETLDKCRAWRRANPERYRDAQLRSKAGIGVADYERMFAAQNGVCAICRQAETAIDYRTREPKRLAIDHDHACCSGRSRACGLCVRGLLCSRCNGALGLARDDPQILAAGARYLRKHARRRQRRLEISADTEPERATAEAPLTHEDDA